MNSNRFFLLLLILLLLFISSCSSTETEESADNHTPISTIQASSSEVDYIPKDYTVDKLSLFEINSQNAQYLRRVSQITEGPVTGMSYADISSVLAIAASNDVVLFDLNTFSEIGVLDVIGVISIALSPNGKILALGIYGGIIKIFNVDTMQEIQQIFDSFNYSTMGTTSFRIDDTGGILYVLAGDRVNAWNLVEGILIKSFISGMPLSGFDISPDRRIVVGTSTPDLGIDETTLRFWDIDTEQEIGKFPMEIIPEGLAVEISDDGNRLVILCLEDCINIYAVDVDKKGISLDFMTTFSAEPYDSAINLTQDGELLTIITSGIVQVYSLKSQQIIMTYTVNSPFQAAFPFFSADNRLFGMYVEGSIVLIETFTGRTLYHFDGYYPLSGFDLLGGGTLTGLSSGSQILLFDITEQALQRSHKYGVSKRLIVPLESNKLGQNVTAITSDSSYETYQILTWDLVNDKSQSVTIEPFEKTPYYNAFNSTWYWATSDKLALWNQEMDSPRFVQGLSLGYASDYGLEATSPDGSHALIVHGDGLELWKFDGSSIEFSQSLVQFSTSTSGAPATVITQFSDDGRLLVVAHSAEALIYLFDTLTWERVHVYDPNTTGYLSQIQINPSIGKLAVLIEKVGERSDTIYVWDTKTLQLKNSFEKQGICSFAMSSSFG